VAAFAGLLVTETRKSVGMYSTCLFCHADLGTNEAIERFPLGRRLAFDAVHGRLWVVCSKCKGWNLTPLEERWEAIEDCERLYRDTRLRVSTDQIGLAKLREGLELVRIGSPQRPEFAAWRYGERLILRRRKTMVQVGAGLTVLGGVVAGGLAVGAGFGGAWWGVSRLVSSIVNGSPDKIITRLPDEGGRLATVRRKHLKHAKLVTAGDEWQLRVPGRIAKGDAGKRTLILHGREALEVATRILPSVNRFGGKASDVQEAVEMLEEQPDPQRLFAEVARSRTGNLVDCAPELRLALEMAAHEDAERRALEGELAELEAAWRDAEEIAAISDNMFLPAGVQQWLDRARGKDHVPSR
jgi:hypothetical protein